MRFVYFLRDLTELASVAALFVVIAVVCKGCVE